MPKVHFCNKGVTVEVERGCSILDAALDNKIELYHTCGGNASCSTCRVIVLAGAENIAPIDHAEREVLDAFDLKPPYRLGCQSFVRGDVEVDIPERSREPRPNKTPPLPKA